METTAICELPPAKALALWKPRDPQFVTWLIKQLAILALARQASVDPATFKLFATSLSSFLPIDLHRAIDKLCHTKRAEGETAFPDLPTIEEAVFQERNTRLKAERDVADRQFLDAQEKHRAEHPEEYVTMAEIFAAVRARRAAKTVKPEAKRAKRKA